MDERRWHWTQGRVDPAAEHMVLSYGEIDKGEPLLAVARVAPPLDHMFTVQFLLDALPCDDTLVRAIIAVCRSLDFYLTGKGERDPWAYAQYHCSSASNIYSEVHWGWTGPDSLGHASSDHEPHTTVIGNAPLLDVTVFGRAAVLTSPKPIADDWKWAVARMVGESWCRGYLIEECGIELTFELTAARFRDTALANLLKATIDGLANQVFAPAPGGQPGPWAREDWRITALTARKQLGTADPRARVVVAVPPLAPPPAEQALIVDLFVPGSPPLYPGDQAGVERVRAWREHLRQLLASRMPLPLADAATTRLGAAFDFTVEPARMKTADLDNFCHPAALAVGALLLGQPFATRNLVALRGTKREATDMGSVGTRIRIWREA